MESRYFTPDADEKLIYLVKENASLYNVRDGNYKDNAFKKTIWRNIASEIGKDVTECKTRWRTIRDSYKKNKRKLESGFMPPRKSKYDRELLQFLDDNTMEKSVKEYYSGIIEEIVEEASDDQYYEQKVTVTNINFEDDEDEKDTDPKATNLNSRKCSKRPHQETPVSTAGAAAEKKKLKRHKKFVAAASSDSNNTTPETNHISTTSDTSAETRNHIMSSTTATTIFEKVSADESEHPILTFFKSMAKTVMTFPPHLIAETRIKVCNVVTDIELRALNDKAQQETSQ